MAWACDAAWANTRVSVDDLWWVTTVFDVCCRPEGDCVCLNGDCLRVESEGLELVGECPRCVGEAPRFVGEAPRFVGDCPRFVGDCLREEPGVGPGERGVLPSCWRTALPESWRQGRGRVDARWDI